ncbi:MAG: DNA topoisomerase IV subunit A [Rickettsiales bacterium]|nr:DNA topoisomerase IV subunit A [Rickettsiales bacterium]
MVEILKSNIDKVISDKYLSYAVSTIISRSLPDVRDGLKPVHRRIIYSMYQLKLNHNSPFKKSARIVGDVMGKFHPHGDQAIYDSLVRLAQNFSTRHTLIEGQGNFGNIDGDNPAAMRYTEARLENITKYFFDGIEEDSVNFIENYDGQNLEPEVLPTKIPNILLNGSSGIAVGMATNIPPHNLFELNNALIELIKNSQINNTNLLKFIKGPDLPTGGEIIISKNEKKEIYTKGKGSFIIKSKWEVENLKNGLYQIVITEIPYQVNKTKIIEQIANLINLKKLPLEDIADESDENIRIILKPKNRKIDSNKLMELCFKLSDLSSRYSCNFNVLENGLIPKQMGLKEILVQFINHRKINIKRKSQYNINKIRLRLEILNGYLIVYKNLDTIIKIIRKKDDPKKEIIKKFKLTYNQADAILSMRLGSLKKLDEFNTKTEIKDLNIQKSFLKGLISNKIKLNKFLIDEIKQISEEVDKNIATRKSTISSEIHLNQDLSFDEFEEVEKITVVLYKDNLLKKFKDHIDLNKLIKSDTSIKSALNLMSNQKILIFVSSGRVYTLDPNLLPSGKSNPKSFIYYIEAGSNEKMINFFVANENSKLLLSSTNGKGFVTNALPLVSNQKKGKKVFNLKSNDTLFKVLICNQKYIAVINKSSKLLIYETDTLPILQKGVGVQLIKIKNNETLSDIKLIDVSDGLTWKTGSKLRKLNDLKFWMGKRAQSGKKVPKYFNKNLKFSD